MIDCVRLIVQAVVFEYFFSVERNVRTLLPKQ